MKIIQTIIPLSLTCKGRRNRFTMIELLMVMVIIAIIVAMMMPAFERLAIGSGVQGGSRAVGGQLRMARQYAVAQRERVAVLMPSDGHSVSSSGFEDLMRERQWSAYRACLVDPENRFIAWVDNTEWQYLPTGSVIAQVSGSDTLSDPPADDTVEVVNIDENGNGSVDYTNVRAVVFAPTGRMAGGTTRRIFVIEGAAEGGNLIIRNRDNYRILEVDEFTGRVSYKDEQL